MGWNIGASQNSGTDIGVSQRGPTKTQTSSAKARVKKILAKTTTAKARIKGPGIAKTAQARARIESANLIKTAQAKATVKQLGVSQTATARVKIKNGFYLENALLPNPNSYNKVPMKIGLTEQRTGSGRKKKSFRVIKHKIELEWTRANQATLNTLLQYHQEESFFNFTDNESCIYTVVFTGPPAYERLPGTINNRYRIQVELEEQ